MESIAGLYRIRCRTPSLRSACFVASRFFPHLINCRRACRLPALRLVGRGVSSSRSVVSLSNRIFDVASTACLPSPGMIAVGILISSSRRAVPSCVSCLLAARLALPSHLIGHHLAPRLPVLRHGWAGREAGSVGVLLAWFRPAVCADVDRSVHAVSSCDVPSVCLPVVSAAGVAIAFSSCPCGACCDVLAYRPSARLVPRLVHRPVGRVGSSRLSPRLSTRWAGRRTDAVRLRRAIVHRSIFSPPVSSPCLLASGRSSPSI